MRKALTILAAVAILGTLALFNSKRNPAFSPNPPTNSASQSSTSSNSSTTAASAVTYKDGTYTGSAVDNPYGTVQVAAVISSGKITGINFLQMPSDQRESQQRTSFSEPYLKQSAIAKQSANIDFVSGATDTSYSFEQSLQAALNQAASS
jgi:uncharacterized protein with FMN-binding domain